MKSSNDTPNSQEPTESPQLSAEHLAQLRDGSGISDQVIAARGYRTIEKATDLRQYGFAPAQCRSAPGLLLPLHTTDGGNGLYVFRPDRPRITHTKGVPKEHKYEIPWSRGVRLDCPPICRPGLRDPKQRLWITEGQKKADALASKRQCAIALLGVNNYKGQNDFGAPTFLADWDYVAFKGREVAIVFDSDVMVNPIVRKALEVLTDHLQRRGAHVLQVRLPGARDEKVGVDDFLLKHSVEDLEALIDASQPAVKPAPAQVELLEAAPAQIDRPLMLLDDKAHAAIWPYVKVTVRETVNKEGVLERHNPPLEHTERRMMIVRSDGAIFGNGTRGLDELGAEIHLPEIPTDRKLWSAVGINRWLRGERPTPADVFKRIVEVIDRFIDFDRSLAEQREMCEMCACYILATWFLDAFNVIGYLWPNGERGSGKTQLLVILAELGYLGQFILSAGSFAALRDLADYGALLCFDDAENLSDPKATDPDKRMLLLAGNRRGSTVPVKEQTGFGAWQTRHVNTYCPRAFSAIRLPDAVLASRTVTVPLIRSGDKKRSNADPLEYGLWPHERQTLADDLWSLAVTHLPQLSVYERKVNDESSLTGRNLEPWRAILAVALWLDENGVEGLASRMKQIAGDYQSERADFESSDLTRLVVRAICTVYTVCTVCTVLSGDVEEKSLSTAEITKEAKEMAADDESGIDPETINSKRVGWILKRLRLKQPKNRKRGEPRKWMVQNGDLMRWKTVYSIFDEKDDDHQKQNGANGENGETVQADDPEPETAMLFVDDRTGEDPNITPPGWQSPF